MFIATYNPGIFHQSKWVFVHPFSQAVLEVAAQRELPILVEELLQSMEHWKVRCVIVKWLTCLKSWLGNPDFLHLP
jgi:hypothetical protein